MIAMPIGDIIMHRMMSFFLNGINHKSNFISYFFKNLLTSNSSVMLRNVNTILQKTNMKYKDIFQTNKNYVKQKLYENIAQPDWRVNMVKELLDTRDNQLHSILEQNEVNMMLKYVSTFR